jgi:transcriptional regulator with XRE-family HTH domain
LYGVLTGQPAKYTGRGFPFRGGERFLELIRLGDKIISRGKLDQAVNKILNLRMKGLSQTEVAQRLGIDRTLVCRLENLGEIRKGRSLAVVGFPILNKKEVEEALESEGVDLIFIMSEKERWQYIKQENRIDLFDSIMEKISNVHSCDQIIVIGSNKRIKIFGAVLDKDIIGFEIGESPIQEDKLIKIEDLIELVRAVKK